MNYEEEINKLKEELKKLSSSTTIPYDVGNAFKKRLNIVNLPANLQNAPRPAVTAPTGGVTTDAEARTAVNSIITALETLGLLVEN